MVGHDSRRAWCSATRRSRPPCRRSPAPRLKRPVPRVISATISGTMTPSTAAVDAVEELHDDDHGRIGHGRKQKAADRQRGEADEQQRPPSPELRLRPDPGRHSATMSCGTTMQAAISTVAQSLDRMVSTLPISGSMAALARWNSRTQPAKMSSGRLPHQRARPDAAVSAGVAALPWARSGSISPGRCRRSASNAGTSRTRGDDEHRAGGQADSRTRPSRRPQAVADRGKARIAPEPLADGRVPDKAEADRGNCRAEHAACRRMPTAAAKHDRKNRIERHRPARSGDHGDGNAGDQPLRPGCIDQRCRPAFARSARRVRPRTGRDRCRPASISAWSDKPRRTARNPSARRRRRR